MLFHLCYAFRVGVAIILLRGSRYIVCEPPPSDHWRKYRMGYAPFGPEPRSRPSLCHSLQEVFCRLQTKDLFRIQDYRAKEKGLSKWPQNWFLFEIGGICPCWKHTQKINLSMTLKKINRSDREAKLSRILNRTILLFFL